MKLLLCTQCNDVVKFGSSGQWRSCACGLSSARYLDDNYHAEIVGDFAHALGLDNHSINQALKAQGSGRAVQPRLDGWLFDRQFYRVARLASKDASRPVQRPLQIVPKEDVCDEPFPLPDSF